MRSIVFLMILVANLHGQAYYDDGMKWKQSTVELDRISILNQSWEVGGDTIIDGRLYKIINLEYEGLIIDPKFDTVKIRQSGSLIGERLVRQEGKKVFQRIGEIEEKLLYDFDLEKGDSIFINHDTRDSGFIVDSIGEYYNGADTLNVYYMSDRRFRLYEGIGWQSGIFNRPYASASRIQNILHCFEYRGFINSWEDEWEWLYSYYPYLRICDLVLATDDLNDLDVVVFPNPSNGPINVMVDRDVDYRIHSLYGSIVKRGRFKSGENLIELSPGAYVISLADAGKSLVRRVVIH